MMNKDMHILKLAVDQMKPLGSPWDQSAAAPGHTSSSRVLTAKGPPLKRTSREEKVSRVLRHSNILWTKNPYLFVRKKIAYAVISHQHGGWFIYWLFGSLCQRVTVHPKYRLNTARIQNEFIAFPLIWSNEGVPELTCSLEGIISVSEL